MSKIDITKLLDDARADEMGLRRFTTAMRRKLDKKRDDGRGGWNRPRSEYYTGCTVGHLRRLLAKHVKKGDPVDVANIAMMIWNREHPKG